MQQRGQAVGLRGLAIELRDAQIQRVQLAPQLLVLFRGSPQGEIAVPRAAHLLRAPRAHALKRRDRADRPHAQQPALLIALDLHRQQEHLRDKHERQ